MSRTDHTGTKPDNRVAVIITCYNQARFLPDAIRSVEQQTLRASEIIVVDDGSSDDTADVARSFTGVRVIVQPNKGLPAARNAGWRAAESPFVVFLDADDRLTPDALALGSSHLSQDEQSAFAAGHYRYINEHGSFHSEHAPEPVVRDHHAEMLRGNRIGMHGTVMYRRLLVEAADGFDETLDACEDYDLYLRLARDFPFIHYPDVVAEYRQHGANMSGEVSRMLPAALRVLKKNAPRNGSRSLSRAYRDGLAGWKRHYTGELIDRLEHSRPVSLRELRTLLTCAPVTSLSMFARKGASIARFVIRSPVEFGSRVRARLGRPGVGRVRLGDIGSAVPVANGAASVERHYLEKFLQDHAGTFDGCDRVTVICETRDQALVEASSIGRHNVIALERDELEAPLDFEVELASSVDGGSQNCIVLLNVLSSCTSLPGALQSLARALTPGGRLMATFPGSASALPAGDSTLRRLTRYAAEQLVPGDLGWRDTEAVSYGNVLASVASVAGIPTDQLQSRELAAVDERYPVLVGLSSTWFGDPAYDDTERGQCR